MSGNKKENTELQYEAERDYVKRFIAEQYVSRGYYIHFHRNIEIYGVVKGEVYVTIAGESCTLKEGQIAVINGFESHSYEIDGEAEIFIFTWERITYAISSSCIRTGNCRDGCSNASRTQPLSRKSKK